MFLLISQIKGNKWVDSSFLRKIHQQIQNFGLNDTSRRTPPACKTTNFGSCSTPLAIFTTPALSAAVQLVGVPGSSHVLDIPVFPTAGEERCRSTAWSRCGGTDNPGRGYTDGLFGFKVSRGPGTTHPRPASRFSFRSVHLKMSFFPCPSEGWAFVGIHHHGAHRVLPCSCSPTRPRVCPSADGKLGRRPHRAEPFYPHLKCFFRWRTSTM